MAHKHELQSLMFTMDNTSSTLNVTANIIPLVYQLENAAFRLKNFTVCLFTTDSYAVTEYIICYDLSQMQYFNEPCIEFTDDQYHEIFSSRFYCHRNLFTSLDNHVENWKNKSDNCCKWNQYDYVKCH